MQNRDVFHDHYSVLLIDHPGAEFDLKRFMR